MADTGVRLHHDAVVLAGGRSIRMGTDKAALLLDGRTLLDHTLAAAAGAERRLIVGPQRRPGWTTVTEPRPGRGPVAALAAGIAALQGNPHPDAPPTTQGPTSPQWVLLLACDHPRIAEAVPALLAEVTRAESTRDTADDAGPAGYLATDDTGRDQYLLGCHRREALTAALAALGAPEDAAMGRLFRRLDLRPVPLGALARDVDDPTQARRAGIAVGDPHQPPR